MKRLLAKLKAWCNGPKLNHVYWLQNKANPTDIRHAMLWDGRNREALRDFVGTLQVRWNMGGSVTIAGYNQITMLPRYFIWDDSDGYDCGSQASVMAKWYVTKEKPVVNHNQR